MASQFDGIFLVFPVPSSWLKFWLLPQKINKWNKRDNEWWTHVADTIHWWAGSSSDNRPGTHHPFGGIQSLELQQIHRWFLQRGMYFIDKRIRWNLLSALQLLKSKWSNLCAKTCSWNRNTDDTCLSIPSFFLYHEVRDCYFVSLLMLIFIVHRPNKFTLSSMIGIFHHLRDFSWEKVNRLSNMEHISTIFIDVLSSNIFIF